MKAIWQTTMYNGNQVRTVKMNGAIWFVGEDIANAIGYANPREAVNKLVNRKDKKIAQVAIPLNGRFSIMTIINENGVDSLLLSKK